MATIRGFLLPEDLYYQVEKHIWVRPETDGTVHVGLTPVAYHLLGDTFSAVSIMTSLLGKRVAKGRSLAMVESLKYIGPLAAPFPGEFLRGNEKLSANPEIAAGDPYGEGWIAALRPDDWPSAQGDLLTGEPAIAAYVRLLEQEKISWV